jgi:hypothetical protein
MIILCFQAPRVSQSQAIGPFSRWLPCCSPLRKGSDRLSFFTKASLPHWSNHYLSKYLHWV